MVRFRRSGPDIAAAALSTAAAAIAIGGPGVIGSGPDLVVAVVTTFCSTIVAAVLAAADEGAASPPPLLLSELLDRDCCLGPLLSEQGAEHLADALCCLAYIETSANSLSATAALVAAARGALGTCAVAAVALARTKPPAAGSAAASAGLRLRRGAGSGRGADGDSEGDERDPGRRLPASASAGLRAMCAALAGELPRLRAAARALHAESSPRIARSAVVFLDSVRALPLAAASLPARRSPFCPRLSSARPSPGVLESVAYGRSAYRVPAPLDRAAAVLLAATGAFVGLAVDKTALHGGWLLQQAAELLTEGMDGGLGAGIRAAVTAGWAVALALSAAALALSLCGPMLAAAVVPPGAHLDRSARSLQRACPADAASAAALADSDAVVVAETGRRMVIPPSQDATDAMLAAAAARPSEGDVAGGAGGGGAGEAAADADARPARSGAASEPALSAGGKPTIASAAAAAGAAGSGGPALTKRVPVPLPSDLLPVLRTSLAALEEAGLEEQAAKVRDNLRFLDEQDGAGGAAAETEDSSG